MKTKEKGDFIKGFLTLKIFKVVNCNLKYFKC